MSGGSDLVAKVTLTGDSTGLVTATQQGAGGLDTLAASAESASTAGAGLAPSYDAAAAAIAGQAEASTAAAAALSASGQAKLDEISQLTALASASSVTTSNITALSAAHSQYNSTVNQARALLAQGAITETQYASAVEGASAQLALSKVTHDASSAAMMEEMAAAGAVGAAVEGLGEKLEEGSTHSMAFARGMGEMGREVGLVRVPVRALTEVFRGLGGVVEFLGPVGMAAVAAAAGITLLVSSEMSAQAVQDKINATLEQSGNLYGLTASQVDVYAQSMTNIAGSSDRTAQSMAMTLVQANVAPAAWDRLTQAATDMAHAYGIAIPEAMDKLKASMGDPAKSAQELASATGMLSQAQVELIQHMEEMGEKGAAQWQLADDIAAHFKGAANNTGFWADQWDHLSTSISKAYEWLSKVGNEYPGNGPQNEAALAGSYGITAPPAPPSAAQQAAQAQAAARQAQHNQDAAQASQLVGSAEQNGHAAEISESYTKENEALKLLNEGLLTNAQYQEIVAQQDKVQLEALGENKKGMDAAASSAKRWEDEIRNLIQHSQEAIAAHQADTAELQLEAKASDGTALSIQALQNQYAITKATLPYVTALTHAHGEEAQKLKSIIDQLTQSMQKQQAAQEELKAKEDVHSQFAGLSSAYASSADAMAGTTAGPQQAQQQSAQIREQDLRDLDNWRTQTLATVSSTEAGYQAFAAQVEDIYNNKLAKIYADDLQRRTDWSAGIERQLTQLNNSEQNWANTSANLLKSFSDESENEFVKLATGGKNVLQDFFTWIEQQLMKLAYQQFLSQSVNGMWASILSSVGGGGGGISGLTNMFGSMFGGGASAGADPAAAFAGSWAGFHGGGTVGATPPLYIGASPAVFAHAQRHHSGDSDVEDDNSVPGLQSDEVPTILQKGERVYTADQAHQIDTALSRPIVMQSAAPANGNQSPVAVHIHNNAPGVQATTGQTSRNSDGSTNIDVMVDQIDRTLAQRSQLGKSFMTQSLENTHGIRRTVTV